MAKIPAWRSVHSYVTNTIYTSEALAFLEPKLETMVTRMVLVEEQVLLLLLGL